MGGSLHNERRRTSSEAVVLSRESLIGSRIPHQQFIVPPLTPPLTSYKPACISGQSSELVCHSSRQLNYSFATVSPPQPSPKMTLVRSKPVGPFSPIFIYSVYLPSLVVLGGALIFNTAFLPVAIGVSLALGGWQIYDNLEA